jgi:MFS family permease
LLHGRKPYLLAALALALPLQFPQALVVSQKRSPKDVRFRTGLLSARAATGLVLGFANVNYIAVLLDLFGASLQSKNPHQEYVVPNDVRRHGGGMGMWLGIWSWCWIASLAVGFQVGAAIIESISPDWGFYVVIFILVGALILNILAPETRRAAYRKSVTEVYDRDENYITRRVSRGECKLHISTEGPLYWFEEVWAGMKLVIMMMFQPGFFVLSVYLGWIYAQIILVIILLGALLSKDYKWEPRYVGAGITSIAIGAFLAIPLTKAGIFSRERKSAFRTDSMTFQKQVTWSSHLVRRAIFMLTLPLMGLAYTLGSAGRPSPWSVPLVFSGALGFLSLLAIAECHGIIMETFDTCDLQPGVNTRHRFESMAVQDRRRRTNYTSFPRVSAGIFASQTIAFILAGVATLVGGNMTRRLGAQKSTGSTAGILLGLTLLLTAVLWRFREVQVIPNHTFGTRRDTAAWAEFKDLEKVGRGADWKAVVIGHPSGKMRRMNVLEMGSLSRWTEIRKLNFLLKGPRLGEDTKRRRFGGN